MIINYAWQFFLLGQFVETVERRLGVERGDGSPSTAYSTTISVPRPGGGIISPPLIQIPGLGNVGPPVEAFLGAWLSDPDKEEITRTLNVLKDCCANIEILDVGKEIDRVKTTVQVATRNEIVIHLKHLKERIADELQEVKFLNVPKSKLKYYNDITWARDVAVKKLDLIREDLSRAGTCYALGQNTACVFHLMRVMEYCVQRFGKKLKVAIDVRIESWHEILRAVNIQIAALPAGKKSSSAQNARKKRFAAASSRLDHVRLVWRNEVMHPKATYDEEEALEVLTGVRAFVVSLSDLL